MTATASTAEPVDAAEISPTARVSSTQEAFVVEVDAPGFHAEELEVDLADHSLRVEGHAPTFADLPRPDFEFSFALPLRVDEGAVEALFDDGVLTVRAPLGPGQALRKIEIRRPPARRRL